MDMGKLLDKIIAKVTGNKDLEKLIRENETADETVQKQVVKMLENILNGDQADKDVEKMPQEMADFDNKGEKIINPKQIENDMKKLTSTINQFKYKSNNLISLLKDNDIFNELKNKIKISKQNFLEKIKNTIIQSIINNKKLYKKYRSTLNFNNWPEFLLNAKMSDDIQLGYAGSDIRKKLYKDFTIEGCLTILGPARNSLSGPSANIKKIEKFVKKEIKKIKKGMEEDKNEKPSLNASDYSKYGDTVLLLSIYFEEAHGYLADILGYIKDGEHVKKSSIAVPDKSLTVEKYAEKLREFIINF